MLIRQKRLNKREYQQDQHDGQHRNGYLIFEEHAHGAAPVGIVGIACAFSLFFVVFCKFKQIASQRFNLFLGKIILLANRKA